MPESVTMDGRTIAALDPEDREALKVTEAMLLRLAKHMTKEELSALITVQSGFQHNTEYANFTREAMLLLSCEMHGFDSDCNEPPEVAAKEDYQHVLEARRRLREIEMTYATPTDVREFKAATRSIGNPRMGCRCTSCGFESSHRVSQRTAVGQNAMNNADTRCAKCKKTGTMWALVPKG